MDEFAPESSHYILLYLDYFMFTVDYVPVILLVLYFGYKWNFNVVREFTVHVGQQANQIFSYAVMCNSSHIKL